MKEEITPLVESLAGILDIQVIDHRDVYLDYLTEKYA